MSEPTYRCGFRVEHSTSMFRGEPGAYRVSKDGAANIIGEDFFDDINGGTDAAFEEFMTIALRPDFPHPYMVSTTWAREHVPELIPTPQVSIQMGME